MLPTRDYSLMLGVFYAHGRLQLKGNYETTRGLDYGILILVYSNLIILLAPTILMWLCPSHGAGHV